MKIQDIDCHSYNGETFTCFTVMATSEELTILKDCVDNGRFGCFVDPEFDDTLEHIAKELSKVVDEEDECEDEFSG